MTLYLNGALFGNGNQIHNYLANQLSFPTYYGRNLDALYDCLTERGEDTTLVLQNWPEEGPFARFLPVFLDAAAQNPHLHIELA